MTAATLEHVNLTVTDPVRLAALLTDLCGWRIRWEGASMANGHTIHIGNADSYLALYTNDAAAGDYSKGLPMNHVAFKVDDLEQAEAVVIAAKLKPFSHSTYDPGPRSFYFFDWDGIEYEVVSYE